MARFEISKDDGGVYWWHLVGDDNECSLSGYLPARSAVDARKQIARLVEELNGAEIVDV